MRIVVSISELTVGVHIWSIINTHTFHLRLMLLSICELRYPESMDNIHMIRTSKSSTCSVFEPGRDFATLSRFLLECRTKINHTRHHVATKYEMSRVSELGTRATMCHQQHLSLLV